MSLETADGLPQKNKLTTEGGNLLKLVLIDGSSILHRAYYAYPEIEREGKPVNAIYGFTDMMWSLLDNFRQDATHIGVIFDAPGKNFRHDIYPEYKANRKKKDDNLVSQFAGVREASLAFGLPCIEKEGYEADDIIATYATDFSDVGGQVVIVSNDKDLKQLIRDGVIEMYDSKENKTLTSFNVYDRFGVLPNQVGDVLALMGDAVDNVPGVTGIGVVTASKLVKQYGTVERIIENANNITRQKTRDAILANPNAILISKKLVTLDSNVPGLPNLDFLKVKERDCGKLLLFLEKMKFDVFIRKLEEEVFE